jgi:hypothetical protein
LRFNLARVHAMAYALKTETCDQIKKKSDEKKASTDPTGPYFGPTPKVIPFKVVDGGDAAVAKKHLQKAIETYQALVSDQPKYLPAQLGLAWCQEQAGNKAEAMKGYRDVIEDGWETERKLKTGPLGGNFLTKEAASYLLPLLDETKDIDEIESINQRVGILDKLPRPVTPIAIPLKDGLRASDIEDRNASVRFDADGTGLDRRWTWITKDAAWLVHLPRSPSGKGVEGARITSGLQLFGNVTFWCFWDNGFQALRSLDDNGDGFLSGAELDNLALWHDKNGDGICDPDEVRPLSYYGIVGLSCDWQTDPNHADRIAYSPRGVIYRDGTTRPTFDLILQQR